MGSSFWKVGDKDATQNFLKNALKIFSLPTLEKNKIISYLFSNTN